MIQFKHVLFALKLFIFNEEESSSLFIRIVYQMIMMSQYRP